MTTRRALHEIITPLNSVVGNLSNMLDGTTKPTKDRLKQMADAVERAITATRKHLTCATHGSALPCSECAGLDRLREKGEIP